MIKLRRWRRSWRVPLSVLFLCMWLRTSLGFLRQNSVQQRQMLSTARKMSSNPKNLIVVIAGPTGVGKSDVAAHLCAIQKGMIISADSVQAYHGVQVGANKPSAAERKETPHLLIDVADCTENYNAADWREDAIFSIQSLLNENENIAGQDTTRRQGIQDTIDQARLEKGYDSEEPLLPVVCGGTMMYLQWLVRGRPDAVRPSETAVQKAQEIVSEFQVKEDWGGAVAHVSSMGEIFATRISQLCPGDWYRLRRTMEVAYTVLDKENKDDLIEKLYTGERAGGLHSLGYDVRCFFLCPDDRMSHTKVVDRRCEEMLTRGLLKETADLSLSGGMPDMATRAIGYRQTLDYLNREDACGNEEEAFGGFLSDFTTATRRYAKKQMSWFRKDKDFLFVPVTLSATKKDRVDSAASAIQELCKLSREDYESKSSDESNLSSQTKKRNEAQGAKMKLYQPERHILKPGSKELDAALVEATACTNRMQAKKPRMAVQK